MRRIVTLPFQAIKGELVPRMKRGARSQAIREYLGSNPQAGPNEVVEGLKAKGVTVTAGLVSSIKYGKMSKKGRRPGRKSAASAITADQLLETKRLADSMGGLDQAQKALDTLRQLQ